jgi:hypothetical protein
LWISEVFSYFPVTPAEIERVVSHWGDAFDAELRALVPGALAPLRDIKEAPEQLPAEPAKAGNLN